jgi:large subunit ribosomal protein L24
MKPQATKLRAKVKQAIAKPHIVKGDTVLLLRGKEKGRRGAVIAVMPKDGLAIVEGLNIVKRHTKQGRGGAERSSIIEREAPLPICALMVIDPATDLPTRVRRVRTGDRSERVAVRGGAILPSRVAEG